MNCELFQIWDLVLLANLVIIKAVIISCTCVWSYHWSISSCPLPSILREHVYCSHCFFILGAVDIMRSTWTPWIVVELSCKLKTLHLTIPGHACLCFLSLAALVTPKKTLYWNGFPEFTNWSILHKSNIIFIFVICDYSCVGIFSWLYWNATKQGQALWVYSRRNVCCLNSLTAMIGSIVLLCIHCGRNCNLHIYHMHNFLVGELQFLMGLFPE